MNQSLERRFLSTVSGFLVSLPFDLKVLFEAKDDPDLDRKAREVACGAILYVLTPGDVAGEKNIIGFVDDVIMVRLALKAIADAGGDGAQAFRQRFAEHYEGLDDALGCFQQFLGPELYGWLAGKVVSLPRLAYRNKRVPAYLDDVENADDLYEQGLTFQTDYEITEQVLADKFKQVRPVVEHLQKRKTDEARKIS
ncbi:MAG TPA: hypothetical protein VKN99_11530 [Polyangia bacterium]|nr:hypothetical protein [Polyangia bacterium]